MDIPDKKSVIFGYFVKNEFMGGRSDSFGHISKQFPKIYTYSPKQVDIIKDNVKGELSHSGSGFLDLLFGKDEEITQDLKKSEDEKREWGEFELRVMLWCPKEEFYDSCTSGEEWKKQQIIDKYMKLEPLEVHKFKVVNNEN